MGQIKVTKAPIEGLYFIEPTVHGDSRGYFMETYNQQDMTEAGLPMVFVQDNQSMSTKGVLRGLHTQKKYPQGKLVRVIRGAVYDVAVDVREGSPTYGQWFGIELSEENKKQFYVSPGFAHGFLVLSDTAEICYKVCLECPGYRRPLAWGNGRLFRHRQCRGLRPAGRHAFETQRQGSAVTASKADEKVRKWRFNINISGRKRPRPFENGSRIRWRFGMSLPF